MMPYFLYLAISANAFIIIIAIIWNIYLNFIRFVFRKKSPDVTSFGSSNPDVIFVLVHGTHARDADWTKPSSTFCKDLAHGRSANFYRYSWSGANRITARSKAAQDLKGILDKLIETYRGIPIFVIGHSHGGSIALQALSLGIPRVIAGIICLSTPVLVARPRHNSRIILASMTFLPVIICILLTSIIHKFYGKGEQDNDYFFAAGLILGFIIALTCWLISKKIKIFSDFKNLDPRSVLFVRMSGDEASALISGGDLLSWIVTRPLEGILMSIRKASKIVKQWRKTCRLLITTPIIILVLVATLYWKISFSDGKMSNIVNNLFLIELIPAFFILILLFSENIQAKLFGFVVISLAMIPASVVIMLCGLLIGPEMLLAATIYGISAENVPPGQWSLVNVLQENAGDPTTLYHSAVYTNDKAILALRKWINIRLETY